MPALIGPVQVGFRYHPNGSRVQTRFSAAVAILMAAAAATMAMSGSVLVLGVALLGLRLGGQGLATHTAYTETVRFGGSRRGRAVSLASLGFPAGEAVLPLLAALAIGMVGWRITWAIVAAVALLVFLPTFLWILVRAGVQLDPLACRRKGQGHGTIRAPLRRAVVTGPVVRYSGTGASGSRCPPHCSRAFWTTGIFLYQTRIADIKEWSLTLMASAFVGSAATRVVSALAAGRLIDVYTARSVYPFVVLPMAFAMMVTLVADGGWAAYAMMAGLGMTIGLAEPVRSSLWAECYGVRHLGAIKAMIASFGVLGAAGSPVLLGAALDAGIDLDRILVAGIVTTLGAAVLAAKMNPGVGEERAIPSGP